jgi:hypothetical protein
MLYEIKESQNGLLTAQVYNINLVEGKIQREVIAELPSWDEDEIIVYLMNAGLDEDELIHALDQMEDLGHNVASFGVMGGFILSKFEGATQ